LKKILVIDDDGKVGETIKALLGNHNYEVEYEQDGKKGFEKIKKFKPDLVVTDLLMPGIHGFDLCKMIKNNVQTRHIPVIAVSAVYQQSAISYEIMEAGIDAFVKKPINFGRLLENIESLLAKDPA
jgi:DNA-binding response OmpR family regulator